MDTDDGKQDTGINNARPDYLNSFERAIILCQIQSARHFLFYPEEAPLLSDEKLEELIDEEIKRQAIQKHSEVEDTKLTDDDVRFGGSVGGGKSFQRYFTEMSLASMKPPWYRIIKYLGWLIMRFRVRRIFNKYH